jgi:hypothetical protein
MRVSEEPVYCDDASLAVAVLCSSSNGYNLYLLSEVLGMGIGEYEVHVGFWDAVGATVFSSLTSGVAWVHQRKGLEACLIRIERAGPKTLHGRADVTWGVSSVAENALADAGAPDLKE